MAVVFGHFGNRIPSARPGALYPTSVTVVRGAGVSYTAPGPPIAEHVMIALDNPLTVTYRSRS